MADELKTKLNAILSENRNPYGQEDYQWGGGYYIFFADKQEPNDLSGPYEKVSEALRDVLDINEDGLPDAAAIQQIEHLAVLYKDDGWYIMLNPQEMSKRMSGLDEAKERARAAVEEIRGKIRREDYAALIQQFLKTDVADYD